MRALQDNLPLAFPFVSKTALSMLLSYSLLTRDYIKTKSLNIRAYFFLLFSFLDALNPKLVSLT